MKIEFKKFDELTTRELYEILKIRSEIFVVEQDCVYNDPDGKDYDSVHMTIKEGNEIMAYVRIIPAGISYDDCSIGRVVVAPKGRRKGYGKRVMEGAIDYITSQWKEDSITIGAQAYLREFYGSLGFKGISEEYLEDGIPHLDMQYKK